MREALASRKHVLALILVSILVRIPRVTGIIGDDAFVVLWMGLALSEGHWEIWTISPVSLFGLHPFTPGAILVPLLIAPLIGVGLPYEAIVIIVSMSSAVIGALGAYVLGAELFGNKQDSFLFALFYSCSHIFMRFTHFSLSLRGPFLAILPLFLLYCVRVVRIRESDFWVLKDDGVSRASQSVRRYVALSALLYLVLLLTHGLGIFVVAYAAVVIGYYILRGLKNILQTAWTTTTGEEALDPKGLMSVDTVTLPLRTREEILASTEWLKAIPKRIPEMDDILLMIVKKELRTTHELYDRVLKAGEIAPADQAEAKLRIALMDRIELVIRQVDYEIESRSSEGAVEPVIEKPGSPISAEIGEFPSDVSDARHSERTLRLLGGRLEFRVALSDLVSWTVFILLIGGAYFVGTRLLPIQAAKTAPLLGLSNTSLLGLSINLVVDYGIRLGLWSIFFPIGALGAFYKDRGRDRRIIHYLLVPGIMFTLPMSTYASVLFLPVFGYYSVIGFNVIQGSLRPRWIGVFSLTFVVAFSSSYQLIVVLTPFWISLLIALIIILSLATIVDRLRRWYSYQTVIGKTLRKWKSVVGQGPVASLDKLGLLVFVLSIIIISLLTTEGLLLNSENPYLSDDEKRIIDFLDSQISPGITFVPTPVIGRRMEAYGFPAVRSFNDGAALYFGWTDPANVTSNSRLSLGEFLVTGTLYVYEGVTPERELYGAFFSANMTNLPEYERAKERGLEFVIVEKNEDGYSDMFHSVYGETFCPLLYSAPLACELVVDGQRMSLFRLI